MIRFLKLAPLIVAITIVMSVSQVRADVIISYGTEEGGAFFIDLQAETANQIVQIFATGIVADGGADGFELDLQIGDGGAGIGGTDTSPVITSVDLITGTIWAGFGPTQGDVVDTPLARQSIVDTTSLVNSDGLIGTIVFDTTGFGTGEIDFLLTGVAGSFDTSVFQGVTLLNTIAPNGTIRVTAVPEPSSMFLMIGLVGFALRRQRSTRNSNHSN